MTNPPWGARETESWGEGDGNERLSIFWSGFKVNILALLCQRMVFAVTPFTFLHQ